MNDFSLQELKLIDPSMGSGHILVYAFDVFMQLYEAEGETPRTAAELILEKNLFGLDIDKRAFQLSYFAMMMKGRQYSRRILSKRIKPNVYVIPTHEILSEEELQLLNLPFPNAVKAHQDLTTLSEGFSTGNDLGSLIAFEGVDFNNLKAGIDAESAVSFLDQTLCEMVQVSELLQQKYAVVVTNPPYMGSSGFNATLAKFAKKAYPNSKSDLFAMFIERWNKPLLSGAYNAMVTMQSWMFLSSYETMRKNIINKLTIANMMHMENMVMGIAFGTVVTIFQNKRIKEFKGTYHQIKTVDASKGTPESVPVPGNRFNQISQDEFNKIPGSPISYWVSEIIFSTFANIIPLGELEKAGTGLQTSNGNRFLRFWYEIDTGMINKKWYHLAKGGSYRKWYGNNEYVVNWENNGSEIKESIVTRYPYLRGNYSLVVKNEKKYFASGVITSRVTSGKLSFRFSPNDEIFSDATTGIFPIHNHLFYLGLLNSPILTLITELNPTLNFQAGDLEKLPLILPKTVVDFEKKVQILITISKIDWDSFEESWDFKKHPLI
ncbi:BREX-1 system adenine-specific DNA-methyltransferase PglX [Lactococcus cremoris]|nr:BREX-1 system adenine-specific DNA-methyltransferase PglX [Lactococcus cremoris]